MSLGPRHVKVLGVFQGQPLPDFVRVQHRFGGDDHQDQRAEGEDRDPQGQRSQVTQFHIGDQDAQQEDLHHRPGTGDLRPAEHQGSVWWLPAQVKRQQHVGHHREFENRQRHAGQEDDDGQAPEAVVVEDQHTRDQRAHLLAALDAETHEGEAVGQHEQNEGGEGQHQRPFDAVGAGAVEAGATPGAARGGSGRQFLHLV